MRSPLRCGEDHGRPRPAAPASICIDIRDPLAKEGIDDDLRCAFIVYLTSHDRPISEVLVPRRKDIAQEFAQVFEGMTTEPVTLDDLLAARETLIAAIAGDMPEAHKNFLMGFKRGSLTGSFWALRTRRTYWR